MMMQQRKPRNSFEPMINQDEYDSIFQKLKKSLIVKKKIADNIAKSMLKQK